MCYYTLLGSKKERLELAFKADFNEAVNYEPKGMVNGFEHQKVPIIMNDNPERIALVRWGLIPTWANLEQAKKIQNQTLNARAETIVEKPAFRDSENRRCLVLVDGFYEWQQQSNKSKVKHLIKLKDEENFALGGIWSYWKNPLKPNSYVRTFAILTVEANPMMAKIHNTKKRMPLIIAKEHYQDWLNTEAKDLSNLIKPFDEKLMEAKVVF